MPQTGRRPVERIDYAPLRQLMADRATRACIDALRDDLTRAAVAETASEEDRRKSMQQLWALNALVRRITFKSTPDQEQAK